MKATLWTRSDALTAAALMGVGAVVWFVGWWEVSDRPALEAQIAPMNAAVLGVVLIGTGQALWFLRGRRAVGDRRRRLLGGEPVAVAAAVVEDELFSGTERFFHRLGCAMVDDRSWAATPRSVHEQAGRMPCGVCAP